MIRYDLLLLLPRTLGSIRALLKAICAFASASSTHDLLYGLLRLLCFSHLVRPDIHTQVSGHKYSIIASNGLAQ